MIVVIIAAAWIATAVVAALGIGRAIRTRDERAACCPHPGAAAPTEVDLLADQPVDVLSPAEVDRRFLRLLPGARS